jgi:cell wall-associated NlpC family hydrolase
MGPTAALLQTVIALAGAGGGDQAVTAVSDSLAMLHARREVESRPAPGQAGASAAARPAPAAEIELPTAEEIAADPTLLPPASAGSNGTHVPHASSLAREEIFAHRRGDHPGSSAILLTGVALAPPDAPEAVKNVINNANMIVGRPYVWGGGHGSFYDDSYDCSGAVSFALFGGGLIPRPLTSGDLMRWGAPGPGKWITVYANAGHTYAEIAGLRFDTVGAEQGSGPRWHLATMPGDGFVARHPPGL